MKEAVLIARGLGQLGNEPFLGKNVMPRSAGACLKTTPSRQTFLGCTSTGNPLTHAGSPEAFDLRPLGVGYRKERTTRSCQRELHIGDFVSNLISYNRKAKNTGHCTS